MKLKKRVLSVLLSASVASGALSTMPSLTTAAAGIAELGLTPAVRADASAAKFTHNEWTGKNGAEDVFALNREPAGLSIVSYQSAEAAADAVWDYNAREDSSLMQMLTGEGEKGDIEKCYVLVL